MWWWVALGIVGVELLVLVLLALSVLLRLVDLARAAGRTQQRTRKAQALQASLGHLQEHLEELAEQAAGVQQRLDAGRTRPPLAGKG